MYLPSLSKYHDLKQQQEELDKQIKKYTRDVRTTREERALLKNDPEYLEKVIRDEMGLVKPGEIVYKFVQDPAEKTAEPETSPSPTAAVTTASPNPSPSPSGVTLEARPVATPKSPPPPHAEPVYPRRETR